MARKTYREFNMPVMTIVSAAVIVCVLLRDAFSAPLRLGLQMVGASVGWFLFDALIAVALAASLYLGFRSHSVRRRTIAGVTLAMIILPVVTGYLQGNGPVAIFAGYKILAPLLLCLNTPRILTELQGRYAYLFIALLVVTFAFLWCNQYVNYQWVGTSIEQFGQKKDVSRLWYSEEGQRLAGATAASVSAAALLVIFYALSRERFKAWWVDLLLLAIAAYGIWLTNSKTTYFSLAMVAVLGNLYRLPKSVTTLFRRPITYYTQIAVSVFFLLAGIIPMWIGATGTPMAYFRYNSVLDRVKFTWPSAMERIGELGGNLAYIVGTGFGSFGSPSYYSQKYIFITSDADNYVIYSFAIFGITFLVLYYLCSRIILKAEGTALCLFGAFAAAAFSTNCEMPENMVALGVAISSVYFGREAVQYLPWKSKFKVMF